MRRSVRLAARAIEEVASQNNKALQTSGQAITLNLKEKEGNYSRKETSSKSETRKSKAKNGLEQKFPRNKTTMKRKEVT